MNVQVKVRDSDSLNVLNIIREGTNGKTTISLQENSRHQEWVSLGLLSHICAWEIGKMKRVIRICHPVTFQARTENLSTSTAHYTSISSPFYRHETVNNSADHHP